MNSLILKHFTIASCFLFVLNAKAQNEQSALLYSSIGAGGSARTMGMAGSFSAIGADPSAVMVNPAGIGMVRRNEFTIGLQMLNIRNKANYLKVDLKEDKLNFNIPTLNLNISSIKYDSKGKPKKQGLANVSYGFNINRLTSFQARIGYDGLNTKSSITDYFAYMATETHQPPADLYSGLLPSIAYSAGAIENFVDGGGNQTNRYASRYIDSQRRNQQTGSIDMKGAIYDYQFTLGANFSHKFYMGLGLLLSHLNYTEDFTMQEQDFQSRNNPDLEKLDYESLIVEKGNGVGARIGFIFKPNDQLRLAIAMHTPKTYKIKSEYGYNITSYFEDGANSQREVNAYTDDPLNSYEYKVTTPARVIGGIGFVFSKMGLVNAELEFYDYSTARMKAKDETFTTENNNIRTLYKNVVIFRIGGEINIPDKTRDDVAYRLRFGYANSPSPYSSKAAGIDDVLKKASNLITGGFGYREKDYYMDFALTYGNSGNYYTPYVTGTSVFPNSSITNTRNQVGFSFTLGANFD
ncbi:MAG: hypothetical protein KG003_02275 [Bacteroidetes bacterium]|nr:hypothetical protein [Bacteroidota bacterium]